MGNFILNRFNGQEIFSFAKGSITVTRKGSKYSLWLSVECEGEPVKELPDTEELNACPSAELAAEIDSLKKLNDLKITIPKSYDEEVEDYVTGMYYCDHQNLDNNIVEIRRINDLLFNVNWTCTTMDVNYYDGSKPDTKIEITGEFVLDVRA